jgi:hypothetical protein
VAVQVPDERLEHAFCVAFFKDQVNIGHESVSTLQVETTHQLNGNDDSRMRSTRTLRLLGSTKSQR